jgi:hypothetical protein
MPRATLAIFRWTIKAGDSCVACVITKSRFKSPHSKSPTREALTLTGRGFSFSEPAMKRLIRALRRLCLSRSASLEFDLMSASQDLVTNVANLQAAVTAYEAAVQAALSAATADDPNVVAANASLVTMTSSITAATAALTPAPAPSPAPAAGESDAPAAQ